ncbi:MAG TPA: CBS domain-containing protein [Planctomycetota bacterium]|nr:CBS domain-containing protein [Planctomycetota bacterium]
MKVQDMMSKTVTTCAMQDTLNTVAQKLWDLDCGVLPVVDPDQRPLAVITDRDVCMAAFTTGKPLDDLRVLGSMSKQIWTCRAQEEVNSAAMRMAKHGVRRLPVVDAEGRLVGMLSLNDLAIAAANEPQQKLTAATADAMRVLQAVCTHRQANPAEAKSAPAALATVAGTTPAPAAIIATSAKSQAQAQIGS